MRHTTTAITFFLLALACGGLTAQAQGVSPVIQNVHLGKHGGTGEFRIVNKGLTSLAVNLEVKAVEWRSGQMVGVRPLDNGCVVDLSETSTLVPIKSEHTVAFKATCTQPVNYFEIFCVMKPVRKSGTGISIASAIGESLYACTKHSDSCRQQYWMMPEHRSGLPTSGLAPLKTESARQ